MAQQEDSPSSLVAPDIRLQPVSVTRKMAASLPHLRETAQKKGLKIHHLGAGYPHPEVTDPRGFIAHQAAYFDHLRDKEGLNDPDALPEYLREAYSYTDTLGPRPAREAFATVYGRDWQVEIDPERLIPSIGATGGISLTCSVFERPGKPVAYITDAPTYAGFLARATLNQKAAIYSVEMDEHGPIVSRFREQVRAARADGYFVPLYYTVPDGHNPAGFSFSEQRRREIVALAREENLLILEDAPYIYINYAPASERVRSFLSLAPDRTVHLFTGSKIGLPGPRVGFIYTEATVQVADGDTVPLTSLLLTEASADLLLHNPEALRGFEALLHDEHMQLRDSLWPVAEEKLAVYRDNREIMLSLFDEYLSAYPDYFSWTIPAGGFFSVFTFRHDDVTTDEAFIARLVSEYGIVAIPMNAFYPEDARRRNPRAGLDQLRLSFCFSESTGEARRRDMTEAVTAFCHAARIESGLPGIQGH
ncbi:MAG TPA: pyridoxal phosphate-dependent aminotransferase [Pseudomonadales bacterium]|nr:pyridoxal phosphate-dependent aminotransferase [Pseudomonadales bacterium]